MAPAPAQEERGWEAGATNLPPGATGRAIEITTGESVLLLLNPDKSDKGTRNAPF